MRRRRFFIFQNHLLILIMLFWSHFSFSQQYFLHAEYRADWYGSGYAMQPDIPGYPSVTLQAQVEQEQFVIESDNNFNKWRKFPASVSNLNTPETYAWFGGAGITDNFLADSAIINQFYTTRLKDQGYSSTQVVIMRTSSSPVGFAANFPVLQSPAASAVSASDSVQIVVNLATARSPEENVFIRYTVDNFATSVCRPVSFSGLSDTSGIAHIPAFAAGTEVNYYAFTTTLDDSAIFSSSDIDLVTLRQAVNGGQNYSYIVNPSAGALCSLVFSVDMSGQTISPSGVFLATSLNGFALSSPMSPAGGNIFVDTLVVDTSVVLQYIFVNGTSTSAQYESVPSACGTPNGLGGFNRILSVPQQAAFSLPTVCFSLCTACSQPVLVSVAFSVNMNQVSVSPSGVFLAGTFNGFSTSAHQMSDLGNGIFADTLLLDTSVVVQYKFVNGTGPSAIFELVPASCGNVGGGGIINREFAVPSVSSVLPTVCFGECQDCQQPVFSDITFRVNMSSVQVSPQGVFLAGSFNNFSTTQTPMTSVGSGIYEATLPLDTSINIQFKYVNGSGTSAVFEQAPPACGVPDGFGGFNRSLVVPDSNLVLPIVCFNECVDCLPVGISPQFDVNGIIFPNPAQNYIRIGNMELHNTHYQLFNATGQLIRIRVIESGQESHLLDISFLEKGLYQLVVFGINGEKLFAGSFLKN